MASNYLVLGDPNGPTSVAVGIIAPLTVPCSIRWGGKILHDQTQPIRAPAMSRRKKREATGEFCADWANPEAYGGSGHVMGWGFAGLFSLGGVGGVEAAKNRNYLVCGLTILGNETRKAVETIRHNLELNKIDMHYITCLREKEVCVRSR